MLDTLTETDETDEIAPVETDANFSVERITVNLNGKDLPAMAITWGTPKRSMVVRDMGLADQFDLVEIAGDRTANPTWMAMAGLAWAAYTIDGMPSLISAKLPLQTIRNVLDRIRPDGLAAYFKALRTPVKTDGEIVEVAKN